MEAALVQGCTLTRAKSHLSSNRRQNLTSLNDRIAEFIVDQFPPDGSPVELLCVDHNGTYVIPFPCHRVEDAWRNFETNEVIEADVAGWRLRGRKASGESVNFPTTADSHYGSDRAMREAGNCARSNRA